MYQRALLSLYRGGISGRRLTGNRYADVVCRRLSVGSDLWSEKSTAGNNGTGKSPGEAEDKTSLPHKEESSEPPQQDTLASLLSGMKVEVSSKKLFQAKKKTKQQSQESTDGIESASRMFQMVAEESNPDEEKPVSKELTDAASAVASTYPSKQNQVESELLRQLRLHKQMAEEIRRKGSDISKVISGMKVTKQRPKTGKQISAEEREFMRDATKKSLYTGKRLKIFPISAAPEAPIGTETLPTLWDLELAKEIANTCKHPPRNGFEEMIQWTKEGKLWTFPIDNEAGLDEEQKVEFHEHIFLENYLEDFPKHGPIRHFMELVICGLSKNPYLTVQQKKDHIDWFHDYFHKKEDLLRACDVYVN
ncbi:small ribosomal subunit protein mS31 [Rhinoderma darwinii]|uniref:small ribosomal subunit protein mS31 n=1 Tax=Rhinoderma darwinii TaxID=43563 RepID=UPI003F676019